jgi:hypothetical protein
VDGAAIGVVYWCNDTVWGHVAFWV